MAQESVHLSDRVLPCAPVRQWVQSLPYELRLLLASRAEVLSAVIRIVMRVVLGFYRKRGAKLGLGKVEPGAVSFLQRSGDSLNTNPHLHIIAIDGVYTRESKDGPVKFHFVEPPSAEELGQMVTAICERVCKMLGRRGLHRGLLRQASEQEVDGAETPTDALDGCSQVALSRGRFERLDEHGRGQQQLFADDDAGMKRNKDSRWAAECKGFSLHAGVSFGALDPKGRERLVRYCTRPPLAMERLSVLRDGSVAYRLKYGTRRRSHRVMQPLEFMARLAAIVAPARLPLTRYHGVLAPSSSWRRQVVPARRTSSEAGCDAQRTVRENATRPSKAASSCQQPSENAAPITTVASAASGSQDVAPQSAEAQRTDPAKPQSAPAAGAKPVVRRGTSYVPWADLLRRTFGINVLSCPVCQATMVLLAVITKQAVIEKILSHVHVSREPLPTEDALYYDVTGEPVPPWVLGVDPEPDIEADQRGPPMRDEFVDPPASEQ